MDDFDDIDNLLDLEETLRQEEYANIDLLAGSTKRVLNDLNQEPGSAQKRARPDNAFDQTTAAIAGAQARQLDEEDDELLAMAAEVYPSQFAAQIHHTSNNENPNTTADAVNQIFEEEEQPAEEEEPLLFKPYVPPSRNAIDMGAGDCVTVTGPDGERVYCKIENSVDDAVTAFAARSTAPKTGLLSTSIHALIEEVDKDLFQRALAAIPDDDNGGSAAVGSLEGGATTVEVGGGEKVEKLEKQKGKKVSSLWVDQYAPQNFMDLLGNEQINREVVHWLKSWDPCVFNKAAPKKFSSTGNRYGNRRNSAGGGASSNYTKYNKNNTTDNEFEPTADPLGRPEHKIILLCGSPGIGKTTLAHVVARHCGYRPFEINASDDRSATTLMSRVTDAAEMQSVLGEKLPNCIIIDEIDGAMGGVEGRGAVFALLKMVNAAVGSSNNSGGGGKHKGNTNNNNFNKINEEDDDSDDDDDDGGAPHTAGKTPKPFGIKASLNKAGGTTPDKDKTATTTRSFTKTNNGGRTRNAVRPLMRPVICICNDPYAPALRPLRDVARVFHFKKPAVERLVHRLQAVCATEGLRAEKSTLRMLAEKTDCDIRSCLNTLQFLAKRQTMVRHSDLEGLSVGQKDMTKGAFHVWGELFQNKKPVARARPFISAGGGGGGGGRQQQAVQRESGLLKAYSMLQDFGEEDLVLRGIHENLPNANFMDMTLQRTSQVLSLIQDADIFLKSTRSSRYFPAIALRISHIIASHERRQIHWPKTGGDMSRRASQNTALVQQWTMAMQPKSFASLGRSSAVMDVLPSLPFVTAPPLRPVSFQLFSREEKVSVDTLVNMMYSLGLNFNLNESMEAAAAAAAAGRVDKDPPLKLRPAVHHLWTFEGRAPAARVLPHAIQQLVAHEVEIEAIRRAEAARKSREQHGNDVDALGTNHAMDVDRSIALTNPAAAAGIGHLASTTTAIAGPLQFDLAQRLREAAGKKATANKSNNQTKAAAGTWLDLLRAKTSENASAAAQQRQRVERRQTTNSKVDAGVLYKYHEGFTNAVKRPTLLFELL